MSKCLQEDLIDCRLWELLILEIEIGRLRVTMLKSGENLSCGNELRSTVSYVDSGHAGRVEGKMRNGNGNRRGRQRLPALEFDNPGDKTIIHGQLVSMDSGNINIAIIIIKDTPKPFVRRFLKNY